MKWVDKILGNEPLPKPETPVREALRRSEEWREKTQQKQEKAAWLQFWL